MDVMGKCKVGWREEEGELSTEADLRLHALDQAEWGKHKARVRIKIKINSQVMCKLAPFSDHWHFSDLTLISIPPPHSIMIKMNHLKVSDLKSLFQFFANDQDQWLLNGTLDQDNELGVRSGIVRYKITPRG